MNKRFRFAISNLKFQISNSPVPQPSRLKSEISNFKSQIELPFACVKGYTGP